MSAHCAKPPRPDAYRCGTTKNVREIRRLFEHTQKLGVNDAVFWHTS
jgi:hypothetical protein